MGNGCHIAFSLQRSIIILDLSGTNQLLVKNHPRTSVQQVVLLTSASMLGSIYHASSPYSSSSKLPTREKEKACLVPVRSSVWDNKGKIQIILHWNRSVKYLVIHLGRQIYDSCFKPSGVSLFSRPSEWMVGLWDFVFDFLFTPSETSIPSKLQICWNKYVICSNAYSQSFIILIFVFVQLSTWKNLWDVVSDIFLLYMWT